MNIQLFKKLKYSHLLLLTAIIITSCNQQEGRIITNFNASWKFYLGDDSLAFAKNYNDAKWRTLNLPHDWSIEGNFSAVHPSKTDGGALPTGIGWYRKHFTVQKTKDSRSYFIEFDGVYRNSKVWINGYFLDKRPNGYIGFQYNISDYLNFEGDNVIAVRVDNSLQPNSRWYTGSGIYRNVHLISTGMVHLDHWGVAIKADEIKDDEAMIRINLNLFNELYKNQKVKIHATIYTPQGVMDEEEKRVIKIEKEASENIHFTVAFPQLWSFAHPNLYTLKIDVIKGIKKLDHKEYKFGIRNFKFDAEKGFFLNGEKIKLKGVNMHHDLGALGAAFNKRAAERQLEILKEMGCNAIRTAHNPPAPGYLDLCDEMGFFVMDEAFDVWAKKKMKQDYHTDFAEWHKKDLQDMVLRDRNHPSVMVWSIGNEIREQFDSTGITITKELVDIVKEIDTTRPVTCALTETIPEKNFIYQSNALDVLSFNYKHYDYPTFPERFPGKAIIASENMSALATRGQYDQPSTEIKKWPAAYKEPIINPNPEFTCSAYDQTHAYWGATHEDTWRMVDKYDYISGMFIWSGFDYIGEPVPYPWPARSAYYGVIDLAGFPKDTYYFYQSIWKDTSMLHLFPHWNWETGQNVDVWVYFNNADEVELFVNDQSKGIKTLAKDEYHLMWRIPFEAGTLKAVSRKNSKEVLTKIIHTAKEASNLKLTADRKTIHADGTDLSFITVEVVDPKGTMVPNADNLINFKIEGPGFIAGVDNGYQASHAPFKANYRKAFKGKALVIVQSNGAKGTIKLKASSEGLQTNDIQILAN